jgi:hypothetical protein
VIPPTLVPNIALRSSIERFRALEERAVGMASRSLTAAELATVLEAIRVCKVRGGPPPGCRL